MDNPEMQRFLQQEQQKAMMGEMVGKLTSVCWDKCITGTPGSKFSSGESTCLTNCFVAAVASASRALLLSRAALSPLPAAASSASRHIPALLRPLAGAATLLPAAAAAPLPGAGVRCFATQSATSSLRDTSPNWSNRPPKETILLEGCDFEHWLVVMEPPPGDAANPDIMRDEIINGYIQTLAQVVGRTETRLLGRVTMPLRLHMARTKCHPVKALRTMLRATCLRQLHHAMQVVANQTTSKVELLGTRRATCLPHLRRPTSKAVRLDTKVDLQGTKVVTKVTKGTRALLTRVVTLATKVALQVTKVATRHRHHPNTRPATPTHLRTKEVAILVTVAQATQAKEATRTTNELDHEIYAGASVPECSFGRDGVCISIN
nr:unnamed protein product [Digitaria exilis]